MTKKVNGGTGAKNPVKVTEAKALAMKVAAMLNGKPTSKATKVTNAKVKDEKALYDARQEFLASHGKAIAAEWAKIASKTLVVKTLKLNSILTTYVLHTLKLTTTKDKHILVLVEADRQFTKDNAKPKGKTLVARESKEAASVARFHATEAQVKNA